MKLPGWLSRTNIYVFGLALMLVSLPTSKFLMSIAQFILIFNWLLDRQVIGKFRQFFSNKPALAVASIFFIHVIGLLWTSDFAYAFKDLRIKLPLLAIPVIIATSPKLNRQTFFYLISLFVGANVFGSLFSIGKLLTSDVFEIRNISVFISHIRFALNLSFALFAGIFLFFQKEQIHGFIRWVMLVFSIWLLIFLVLMESITGLGVVLITSLILLLLAVFHIRQFSLKLTSLIIMIAIPVSVFIFLQSLYHQVVPKEPFYHENLDKFTSSGNPYYHDSALFGVENGHWVGQYLEIDELKAGWNARSRVHFDTLDQKGNPVRFTLIRYLTSKGLRKDADGVKALTNEDVQAIERGIANVDQLKESSLSKRIKTVIWEIETYHQTGHLKDNSVTQRLEFWRAGTKIISENLLFGVGTGDIDRAFKEMYPKMKSQLPPEQWWRTHNQYLTVFATLGLFGLLWFIFALTYPGIKLKMFNDYFYFVFFCIASLSMITGDTLDTQAGVTFWAFFTTWFLLGRNEKDPIFT
ncbi:MAG: O-antigen ligase family protein [Bacteroidales bacterium]|nr:O-antigen ligase family protein [Bacteroidales bacterium]